MYNHKEIEKKWQNYWEKNKTFKIENDFSKPKYYTLDMFPYPSGAGLHVGHPEGMTANDIVARYKTASGFNVLHPMGWDAFGLPAENYAIKTGTHPRITTDQNIATFKKQIKALGFSYDWDREIDTTDPEYYKWTQWIFLKLFEKGLAYEQDLPINYCPSCKTGLANEEVLNDFTCERCGEKVVKKKIRQWVLAITKYADRLLKDVDKLDWPESIKEMQRNWIGKSEGCEFEMKLAQKNKDYLPVKGDLNGRAKSSFIKSIFKTTTKVKKKSKKSLNTISGLIKHNIGNIVFNGKNIEKHFNGKTNNEIHSKKKLALMVYDSLLETNFTDNNIGYIIYKSIIIKFILGKQSNGNFFVKTYYVDDRLTKQYKIYLEKQNNIPKISVYTTRIDTVFGMTYAVLAPDHKDVDKFITPEQKEICEKYIEDSVKKSNQDRTQDDKEKTGVFTGSYVINPFNGKEVPLWIGDYVLGNYGTGAVMAVPAHDERDFEFAKKYNLEIRQSIAQEFIGFGGGKGIPKKEVETLNKPGVAVVLLNKKGDKVLTLNWKHNERWKTFITGGIDNYESILETAIRELKEETGYIDIKFLGKQLARKTNTYHPAKNVNFSNIANGVLFQLQSDKQISISNEEKEKHELEWIKISKVKNILTFDDHKILVEQFFEKESAFTDLGILVNSGKFDGLTSKEAQEKLIEFAEKEGFGKKKINYKLRDWLFSRQRYWGEPIPLVHLESDDIEKLDKISDIKKMKVAIPQVGVTHNGDSAKLSSIRSILEDSKKVKRNYKKIKFDDLYLKENTKKGVIIFNGKKLRKHFYNKKPKEFRFRKNYGNTIINNLDNIVYETNLIGYIIISGKIFRIILEKLDNNKYNVKTYYSTQKYIKIFNKAYIKNKKDGDYLIIKGQTFSKIYDGIYGKIVCDYRLPLKLPEVEKFEPAGDGQSPLANVDEFVKVELAENLTGKRETNTMPQWGGSCWYYLRYMDPDNKDMLVNPEVEKYWGQVDSYVGGAEHAVLHLLYARFWHKFLFDIGVVSNNEPFYRLRNQGLILAHAFQRKNGGLLANDLVEEKKLKYFEIETGEEVNKIVSKMSKSLKNVVNPDDIVEQYGADSLRLYEMYMAEFKDTAPWDTTGIKGVRRFIEKSERLFGVEAKISKETDENTMKLLHKTIKKVSEDIENYKFNTAISALMILVNNGLPKDNKLQQEWKNIFVRLLHPFTPHLSEELWEIIGNTDSVFKSSWPKYDKKMIIDDTIIIAVQVLGKVRGTIEINKDEDKNSVLEKAKTNTNIIKWVEGKELVKEIYIPGKIVNLVIKGR